MVFAGVGFRLLQYLQNNRHAVFAVVAHRTITATHHRHARAAKLNPLAVVLARRAATNRGYQVAFNTELANSCLLCVTFATSQRARIEGRAPLAVRQQSGGLQHANLDRVNANQQAEATVVDIGQLAGGDAGALLESLTTGQQTFGIELINPEINAEID